MRRPLSASLLLLSLLLPLSPARAEYPDRPVRILMPLAAGSAVDVVTRIVAEKMSETLGQKLFIDNNPGAGGLIGARLGARATPDGYTILAVNDSVVTVLPNLRTDAGYDPRKDYVPITQMVRIHWALIANPEFAARTVPAFLALARAKPGAIDYASGGQGSPQQMAMELLMRAAGIKLTHVPFRGATPALNEVVAGHVPVMFAALPTPLPFLPDKRLIILGTADPASLPTLPDVPAIAAGGVPGFTFTAWGGLFAPAGTPGPIVAKLHDAAVTALQDPAVRQRLEALGYDVVGGSSAELGQVLAADTARMADVIKGANLHAE